MEPHFGKLTKRNLPSDELRWVKHIPKRILSEFSIGGPYKNRKMIDFFAKMVTTARDFDITGKWEE